MPAALSRTQCHYWAMALLHPVYGYVNQLPVSSTPHLSTSLSRALLWVGYCLCTLVGPTLPKSLVDLTTIWHSSVSEEVIHAIFEVYAPRQRFPPATRRCRGQRDNSCHSLARSKFSMRRQVGKCTHQTNKVSHVRCTLIHDVKR